MICSVNNTHLSNMYTWSVFYFTHMINPLEPYDAVYAVLHSVMFKVLCSAAAHVLANYGTRQESNHH